MSVRPATYGTRAIPTAGQVSPYMRSAVPPLGMAIKATADDINYIMGRGYPIVPVHVVHYWNYAGEMAFLRYKYCFGVINRPQEVTDDRLFYFNRIHLLSVINISSTNVIGTWTIDEGMTYEVSRPLVLAPTGSEITCAVPVSYFMIQQMAKDDLIDEINVEILFDLYYGRVVSYGCFEVPRSVISAFEDRGLSEAATTRGAPIYDNTPDQESIVRMFDPNVKLFPRRVLFNWSAAECNTV